MKRISQGKKKIDNELDLSKVKLKTLLIQPPDEIVKGSYYRIGYPLGIAMLQGFLNSKGYYSLNVFDFSKKNIFSRLLKLKHYSFLYNKYKYYKFLISRNILRKLRGEVDDVIGKKGTQDTVSHLKISSSLNNLIMGGITDKINKNSKLYKTVESLIKKNSPDLVGLSIIHHNELYYALQIAKIIKSIKKDIFIVLGGQIITIDISYIIRNQKLRNIIDGLVVSDGEEPMARLILTLENSKGLENIPNLYYKSKQKFIKSKSSFRKTQEHLKIIPNFDGLNIHSLNLCLSVGCYWGRCAFCTFNYKHEKYIIIKPDDAVKIIKALIKKYGIRTFYFFDSSVSPHYLKMFSEKIINEKLKLTWGCPLCFDKAFMNESIPRIMKKAGCSGVSFGLESMSERVLGLMNKMQRPEDIKKILDSFKKANIKVRLNVMFGFPTENMEEAKQTISFLDKNKDLYWVYNAQIFNLNEGTPIFRNPSEYNITEIDTSDKYHETRYGFRYKVSKGIYREESRSILYALKENI